MIAKNLGFDYAQLRHEYEAALHFLERARTLAVQAGERQLEGLWLKDMGNCYFWQQKYQPAITYYQAARKIFKEGGNKNWLAAVYLDLTEAYAEAHKGQKARCRFKKGRVLAEELGHSDYLAFVGYLLRKYPNLRTLDLALNPRQVWVLNYVAKHSSITNRRFRTKRRCSAKTAYRDLEGLCKLGVFESVGEARATVYRFAPPPTATAVWGFRPVFPFSLALLLSSTSSEYVTERTPTQPVEAAPPVWFSPPRVLRWPPLWVEGCAIGWEEVPNP